MRKTKTGNNQYLKEMNQSIVLELIRTNKGISRIVLAQKTGLSPTAIGAIVRTLLKDEYIREVGEGKSTGGRKPTILEIRENSYYAFGFDIDMKFIYTMVLDTTGKVHYENKLEVREALTPEDAIDRITDIYNKVTAQMKLKKERILGAGISIPGMMDLNTRKIMFAPNLGWTDVDMLESLKERLGIPVYIDNEATCSAICENWLGMCKGIEDFICINIESGIGAGIFMRGMLYRGHSGSAGEVGHIPVDENGPKCKCGNIGCLESIASTNAMVSKYQKLLNNSKNIKSVDYQQCFENMMLQVENGDKKCLDILKEAAISLGKAIGYLINVFNPEQIVLGKKFPRYSKFVLDDIRHVAMKTALEYPAQNCRILPSLFGENSSAMGASIIPIRKLFGY
ncbi:MAG: ROK family transcriptional regulator [Clostridiaceae bacterium]|nr:ROK family transcriptional regulator [Clostridiaceae bacterium]